jgi:hypothetical protein
MDESDEKKYSAFGFALSRSYFSVSKKWKNVSVILVKNLSRADLEVVGARTDGFSSLMPTPARST